MSSRSAAATRGSFSAASPSSPQHPQWAPHHARATLNTFEIDVDAGRCRVEIIAADATDPLYRLKKNENLVAFTTDRYVTAPLIIKGAAAGAELAAAGIFADLLRLTTYSEYFA